MKEKYRKVKKEKGRGESLEAKGRSGGRGGAVEKPALFYPSRLKNNPQRQLRQARPHHVNRCIRFSKKKGKKRARAGKKWRGSFFFSFTRTGRP
jgi:hypothetical protein